MALDFTELYQVLERLGRQELGSEAPSRSDLVRIASELERNEENTRAGARTAIAKLAAGQTLEDLGVVRSVPSARQERSAPVAREGEDLLGEFLSQARRRELSGPAGMSTQEIFSSLRGMQKQDAAGTRLAGLANAIRSAFTKDTTRSKYERKEPEAPEMTPKDKLKLEDIQRALKNLAANKQKIIEGDLDAAETYRKMLGDLLAKAQAATQLEATTSGRRSAAQMEAKKGALEQANKAIRDLGFGELTDPKTDRYRGKNDAERVEIATTKKYRPSATAELILTSDDPESVKKAIFDRIDASSGNKSGDLTDDTRLKEAIEAEVALGRTDPGMMYAGSDSADRVKAALQDAVLAPETVVVYAPKYEKVTTDSGEVEDQIVGYQTLEVESKADLDSTLRAAGEGARIGLTREAADSISANLFNPHKMLKSGEFVLTAVADTYAVLGAEDEVEALRTLTEGLGADPKDSLKDQIRSIAGIDPATMAERLAAIETERADLFKEVPTVPRPVTKQTLQQEIARRQQEFGREKGVVLPDHFYRQTYRQAAKEGRKSDMVPFAPAAPISDPTRDALMQKLRERAAERRRSVEDMSSEEEAEEGTQ